MRSISRAIYSPTAFDLLFGITGVLAVVALVRLFGMPIPLVVPADNPLLKALAVAGVAAVACIASMLTSRIDQKLADDYLFQTLTKSAFIAVVAHGIAMLVWYGFFVGSLGALSSFATALLAYLCWTVSYVIVRLRGTGA